MKLIEQSVELMTKVDTVEAYKFLEEIGRVCYKSEDKITDTSAEPFLRNILKRGHESVIEHLNLTFRIITDRGVTHELVRHRIASYSQESTRYVNYGGKSMEFIMPVGFKGVNDDYLKSLENAENTYNNLTRDGYFPQEARAVLPNALKTEIITTMNLREWRHFLRLRMSPAAHPQMRDIAYKIYEEIKKVLPLVVEDILHG